MTLRYDQYCWCSIVCQYTVHHTQYDRLSQQQLSFLLHLFIQLFDFDAEIRPVLEVLVGKTLEQSLLEVLSEEELADLRQQQRMFEELRNAEMAEQQRLQEQDRRLVEEKVSD